MGYARAGFEVVGVDIKPQPHYPFEFHQGDAMTWPLDGFDVVHASPPCQAYSITKNFHTREHPDLLPITRVRLRASGLPWIVENVEGAPMPDALTLCGSMFDLTAWDDWLGERIWLRRHRLFESSVFLLGPGPCRHPAGLRVGGVYGGGWRKNRTKDRSVKRAGGYVPAEATRHELMGMYWGGRHGLNQAIPPAYTEWIGTQLLATLADSEPS